MVYVNHRNFPSLYKNKQPITNTSNQQHFRKNYLEEYLKSQEQTNQKFKEASIEASKRLDEVSQDQLAQYFHVLSCIEEQENRTQPIYESVNKQEHIYQDLLNRFNKIEKFNEGFMKKANDDQQFQETIINQLTLQDITIHKLLKKFDDYEKQQINLYEEIEKQKNTNDVIGNSLEIQEAFHQTIFEKLEQQDALNHKTASEVEHLKTALFERVNFVVEKLEAQYKHLTNYVGQFFKKSIFLEKKTSERKKEEQEFDTMKKS
ncbi:hypothetical protein ACNRWW_11720 [Metabacillus sp. HB246100]